MTGVFDDLGVRFEYDPDWELDVSDDGPRTTVVLQSPGGAAFALVTVDLDRPSPAAMVDEVVVAMRDEYPDLEVRATRETIAGREAVGHDLEFLSLDMAVACAVRCFRTPRRTVMILGQWSDLDDDDFEAQLRGLRRSLEETDG